MIIFRPRPEPRELPYLESVTMRLKTDEAVEEALAAIEKLTDADVNIDNELDEQGCGL